MLGPGYAPTNNVNGQPLPIPYRQRVNKEQKQDRRRGRGLNTTIQGNKRNGERNIYHR